MRKCQERNEPNSSEGEGSYDKRPTSRILVRVIRQHGDSYSRERVDGYRQKLSVGRSVAKVENDSGDSIVKTVEADSVCLFQPLAKGSHSG